MESCGLKSGIILSFFQAKGNLFSEKINYSFKEISRRFFKFYTYTMGNFYKQFDSVTTCQHDNMEPVYDMLLKSVVSVGFISNALTQILFGTEIAFAIFKFFKHFTNSFKTKLFIIEIKIAQGGDWLYERFFTKPS